MTYLVIGNSTDALFQEVEKIITEVGDFGKISLKKATEVAHPDIHIVDGFNAENSIGIAEMRQFSKTLHKKPFKAKQQLGIILGFEKATIEAQNAMLKEFEDHATSVCYILAVVDEASLLATIRSRATTRYAGGQQQFDTDDTITALAENFLNVNIDTVSVFAQLNKKEWSKHQAEQALSVIYQKSTPSRELFSLLQKCAEFLANNVAPKQVLSYALFTLRMPKG